MVVRPCKAVTELLRRPRIIWRLANPQQAPSQLRPSGLRGGSSQRILASDSRRVARRRVGFFESARNQDRLRHSPRRSASITSQQKKSLTRAVWKASDVEGQLPSPAERRAFNYLCERNLSTGRCSLATGACWRNTAPRRTRAGAACPRQNSSSTCQARRDPGFTWMRKLLSRCEDFWRDYHLQALLYNVCGGSRGRRQWSGARRSREWPPSSWR